MYQHANITETCSTTTEMNVWAERCGLQASLISTCLTTFIKHLQDVRICLVSCRGAKLRSLPLYVRMRLKSWGIVGVAAWRTRDNLMPRSSCSRRRFPKQTKKTRDYSLSDNFLCFRTSFEFEMRKTTADQTNQIISKDEC